jgi:hypothetical protein
MPLSETCVQIEMAGKNYHAGALPEPLDTVRHELIAARAELNDITQQHQA